MRVFRDGGPSTSAAFKARYAIRPGAGRSKMACDCVCPVACRRPCNGGGRQGWVSTGGFASWQGQQLHLPATPPSPAVEPPTIPPSPCLSPHTSSLVTAHTVKSSPNIVDTRKYKEESRAIEGVEEQGAGQVPRPVPVPAPAAPGPECRGQWWCACNYCLAKKEAVNE